MIQPDNFFRELNWSFPEKLNIPLFDKFTWVDYESFGFPKGTYFSKIPNLRSYADQLKHLRPNQKLNNNSQFQEVSSNCQEIDKNICEYAEKQKIEVVSARFSCLSPKSFIRPHTDYSLPGIIRIHFPIVTCKNNTISFYNKKMKKIFHTHMHLGGCFAIDPMVCHSVSNNSETTNRVHLILNVKGNLNKL